MGKVGNGSVNDTEMTSEASQTPLDCGLGALVMLLRFQGIGIDPKQIRHQFAADADRRPRDVPLRKGVWAQSPRLDDEWVRLDRYSIARQLPPCATAAFCCSARRGEDKIIVQAPYSPRPSLMTRAEFEAVWRWPARADARSGLPLPTWPADSTSPGFSARFTSTSPAERSAARLVLPPAVCAGVAAILPGRHRQGARAPKHEHARRTGDRSRRDRPVRNGPGILRTYLFSHTTNRIDVELGARLFRHLLALPISYFQARRVGDSVARVRELENIRNFLTSSALTLVIDLFFTFVFLAVMYFYSPLLTWIVLASFPFYIAISAAATPLFRRRLDEKFQRGAENQAFLVESVTGVETLKAMAVEPQMQRRWEEQLAGYVAASFRVISLGNTASQSVQFISKLVTVAILYVRREAGHRRRPDRRRTGSLQPVGRPRQCAGAAAGADLAGFPSGATVGRIVSANSQHSTRADLQSGPCDASGRSAATSPSSTSHSAIALMVRKFCTTST